MEAFEDPFNRRTYPWGREDQDLVGFYRALIRLKHEYPALRTGSIYSESTPACATCFVRQLDDQRLRVVINGGTDSFSCALNGNLLLLHNGRQEGNNLMLEQWGGAVILDEGI